MKAIRMNREKSLISNRYMGVGNQSLETSKTQLRLMF